MKILVTDFLPVDIFYKFDMTFFCLFKPLFLLILALHTELHQNNFQTTQYSEEMDFRKWILFATEIYIVVR